MEIRKKELLVIWMTLMVVLAFTCQAQAKGKAYKTGSFPGHHRPHIRCREPLCQGCGGLF